MRRDSVVPWKSLRHHTAFVFAQASDQEHSKKGNKSNCCYYEQAAVRDIVD
jgi:hypothetical protein